MRTFGLVLLAVSVSAVAGYGRVGSVVASPCLTSGVEATNAVSRVRQTFSFTDSAAAVNAGYPFKPANVTILADSTQCSQVIQSFNALFPVADSLKHISAAYVAKAWPPSVYGLYWPATDSTLAEAFIFDSAFVFKFRVSELK